MTDEAPTKLKSSPVWLRSPTLRYVALGVAAAAVTSLIRVKRHLQSPRSER